MAEIERYRDSSAQKSLSMLSKQFYNNIQPDERLILVISTDDHDINIKELSSYLDLIYRIDGFLSRNGYARYVQVPADQIHISQIRHGSIEYIIERLLNSVNAGNLLIIYLVLKALPQAANAVSDLISKYFDIMNKREDYFDKRGRRLLRKSIREVINEEVEITNLDKKSKEKLVDVLDEIYVKNRRAISPASRFGRKYVKNLKLLRRRNAEDKK